MAKNKPQDCELCGTCCHFEIPLTLYDVHRLARHLAVPDRKVFEEHLQRQISTSSGLFKIRKETNRACVFLDDTNRCSIHAAKPRACMFFTCTGGKEEKEAMLWAVRCEEVDVRVEAWEHSVASAVTRSYIASHGAAWHDESYGKAIASIEANVRTRDSQKLKIARGPDGQALAMVYDCSRCANRGAHTCETPITIDDIRRIATHLDMGSEHFFREKLASDIAKGAGVLELKRQEHCVFFRRGQSCQVEQVRPMHCRFTTCPLRTKDDETFDCLFLGSGTVEEQFRHQVALELTRQYVTECGSAFNERVFEDKLCDFEKLASDKRQLGLFLRQIASYRYLDGVAGG